MRACNYTRSPNMGTSSVTYLMTTSIIIFYQLLYLYPNTCLCCPQDQKEYLLQFKELLAQDIRKQRPPALLQLTGLNTWSNSTNSSISDCCTWPEVTCSFSSSTNKQVITDLELFSIISSNGSDDDHEYKESTYMNYNHVNSDVLIPLFHISTLTFLDLSYNYVGGAFPAAQLVNLASSKSLVSLDMNKNLFSGDFPKEFYRLKNLQVLDISHNFFNGTLSDQLGGLRNLKYLDMSGNSLHGEIAGIGFGNLTLLSNLFLHSNFFSGPIPVEIGNLVQLGSLELASNQFSGGLPSSLLQLSNLATLDLRNNSLSLQIPPSIGHNLSFLNSLLLSHNHFTGEIPQSIGSMRFLNNLAMRGNMLSGSIPPILFNQTTTLKYLDLSNNNFFGPIPDTIGRALNLQVLLLYDNNISGSVPQSLSNMTSLMLLDLSNNKLASGDDGPENFPTLPSIENLDLTSNRFSGRLPLRLFGSSLKRLFLGENEYSGVLLPHDDHHLVINKFQQLTHFDIHDNNISGEVPSALFNLSSLQVLIIRNNFLEGSIPSFSNNDQFVSKNTNLRILDLSNNRLSGSIPPEIGNLSHIINPPQVTQDSFISGRYGIYVVSSDDPDILALLVKWKNSEQSLLFQNADYYTLLDFSNNQLSGHIPESIGNLRGLRSLDFANNDLSGNIPLSLGGLQNLEVLDLSHNRLSGQIPYTFSRLSQLNILDLSNNMLSGRIPNSPQLNTINDPKFYANNSGICGNQIEVPCPEDKQRPTYQPKDDEKDDNDELLHACEGAVVGFVIACMGTMVILYASGYFIV